MLKILESVKSYSIKPQCNNPTFIHSRSASSNHLLPNSEPCKTLFIIANTNLPRKQFSVNPFVFEIRMDAQSITFLTTTWRDRLQICYHLCEQMLRITLILVMVNLYNVQSKHDHLYLRYEMSTRFRFQKGTFASARQVS